MNLTRCQVQACQGNREGGKAKAELLKDEVENDEMRNVRICTNDECHTAE